MVVDDRAGSKDLYPLLRQRGVRDVELGRMEYGDVSLVGNGPEGAPVLVGVEYKRLGDMISCIEDGRFSGHQLPGMLESFDRLYLVVEGIWREGRDGMLEVPRGAGWKPLVHGRSSRSMASSLRSFLFTMSEKIGIRVMLTGTPSQTVDWLYHLNRWWTGKEWEEHRAYLSFDNSSALSLVSRPSLVRRVAKELPGVGWERSGAVAKHFDSVVSMAMAEAAEWENIDGIGKTTARRVVAALEGREER